MAMYRVTEAARIGLVEERSDAELLASVRRGDAASYAALWDRHRAAALRAGRALMPDRDSAEDLVADAFVHIARAIADGHGPTAFFRAYLFTTMRNRASRLRRVSDRELMVDDLGDVPTEDADPVIADGDLRLAVAAFHQLPERLRLVLWKVDVEQLPLARVAVTLGTSPNNVARLVGRARRRLRTLFVQAHVEHWNGTRRPACADIQSKLGAHVTGELSRRDTASVDDHLSACAHCTSVHETLVDIASSVRRSVLPTTLVTARGA